MKNAMKISVALVLILLLASVGMASNQEPQTFLKNKLDQFISVLQDPAYKDGKAQDEQMDKIWAILRDTFDFHAVSQRALGRYWRKFKDNERDDFSTIFADLLGETYLTQIRQGYQNEEMKFLEQQIIKEKRALVKTNIMRKSGPVKVDYMLYLGKKGWRVYDVKVEGVSLVKNYRAQFSKILLNKTPAYLTSRVKEQVTKIKEKNKAK
jgi:phospholipid transport system substrate-binding protein